MTFVKNSFLVTLSCLALLGCSSEPSSKKAVSPGSLDANSDQASEPFQLKEFEAKLHQDQSQFLDLEMKLKEQLVLHLKVKITEDDTAKVFNSTFQISESQHTELAERSKALFHGISNATDCKPSVAPSQKVSAVLASLKEEINFDSTSDKSCLEGENSVNKLIQELSVFSLKTAHSNCMKLDCDEGAQQRLDAMVGFIDFTPATSKKVIIAKKEQSTEDSESIKIDENQSPEVVIEKTESPNEPIVEMPKDEIVVEMPEVPDVEEEKVEEEMVEVVANKKGLGKFLAVGYGGMLAVSEDGVDWDIKSDGPSGDNNYLYRGAAFGNGIYCAVGGGSQHRDANFYSRTSASTDLINWTHTTYPQGKQWIGGVAHDGSKFVAVGGNGRLMHSEDCVNWEEKTSVKCDGEHNSFRSLIHLNGKFIAELDNGKNCKLQSDDGVTWTQGWPAGTTFNDDTQRDASNGDVMVRARWRNLSTYEGQNRVKELKFDDVSPKLVLYK